MAARIPRTKRAALVRTDFSDDQAWQHVCDAVSTPAPELVEAFEILKMAGAYFHVDETDMARMFVEAIDDPQFSGVTIEQLLAALPDAYPHRCLFVFDGLSASDADHPLLVVDLVHQHGRTFRTLPSQAQMIDSNLSIANMGWEEYADNTDEDSVFRGFPSPPGK